MRRRQAEKIINKHRRGDGEYSQPVLLKACLIVVQRCRKLVPIVLEILQGSDNILLDLHMNPLEDRHAVRLELVRRTGKFVQATVTARPYGGKYPQTSRLDA